MTVETTDLQILSDAAFEAMTDEFRRAMGVGKDWLYREIPWVNAHVYNVILDGIGRDNMRFISSSQRTDWPDGPYQRGSFLISPLGRENLASNGQELLKKAYPKT